MTTSIFRAFALGCIICSAPPGAWAQAVPAPPIDVPARVIELINRTDTHSHARLLEETLAPKARADSARLRKLLAQLTTQGAPYELVQREDFGRHVILKLRSAPARRVIALQVSQAAAPAGTLENVNVLASHAAVLDSIRWPTGRLTQRSELAGVIRHNLARLNHAGVLSGVVYILKGDSVLLAESYGMANREYNVANTLHTRFAIASMGKMFTATAIMQLVQAGRLGLEDTVARVLPAYPNAERARRITIRQLLEHTAGLGDQWSTPKQPVEGVQGQLALAAAVAHAPLRFEPGSRWGYSNEGYVLLAAIIEHVSGLSFHEYLQRHIFNPAGMHETVLAAGPDDYVPHRAVGYRAAADDPLGIGAPRANWSFLGRDGASGAGGGYSTAADLARFGAALRNGVLLSTELRDSMWAGRWPIPGHANERYGWGSFVASAGDRIAVGHGGGGTGSGMDNGFRHFTDGSYTVVVLTNTDPPLATNVTSALVKLLAEQPI